ncbi:hypothetical protein [Holophaga foetida]|uniref:hypothetical protein n=1 Tax=Holophaga foetida TaxID=35839 RepID=UPI000247505D|nr:hypothetical protein [Holophaga foetida]
MFRSLRHVARILSLCVLGAALSPSARAQLDPRLMPNSGVGTTDFLDLFQQSSTSVKPEVLTIFDFSGSMQSLMYHPCYYNTDVTDNTSTAGIVFELTGVAGNYHIAVTIGDASWGYTSTQLIRPDGSVVTEAGVNSMTSQTPRLWGDKNDTGAGTWACDVRNWVRSASHVRVVKGSRTIDIPIPWKVMDANSTGYPLSSMTVKDEYIETDKAGVTHTHGTGHQIEVDTRYKVQDFPSLTAASTITNNRVLSGDKTLVVTRTKFMVRLLKDYLDWLFTGTYQNTDSTRPDYTATPSLVGKYIVFDAASISGVGRQTRVNQGQGFGTFNSDESDLKALAIPARDRVQAVKEAAIKTWITYQSRVFWAYRFLDDTGEAGNDGHNNATATTINNNSSTTVNGTDATTTWVNGKDTGWTRFNGNSEAAMTRLAALFPYTNTPLSYAMARGLAQLSNPNNLFTDLESDPYPLPCQKRFVILFTDGMPTVDNFSENHSNSPYISGTTGNAQAGNAALIATPDNINPGKDWWNIFTLAGAAAHLADNTRPSAITSYMDPPTAYPTTSSSPSSFLPFSVAKRGSVSIDRAHQLVTTMTVGVSLAGAITDASSPKRRLFLAAAVGEPARTSWDLSALKSYTLLDSNHPEQGKTADSTYFFDATNPDLLIKSLGYAMSETTSGGQTGVTSSPNLPVLGASAGKQIYIAKFLPPVGGGAMWSGDLLMFPTKVDSSNNTVILDKTGVPTTDMTVANAVWAASANIPLWGSRKLRTRMPNATDLSDFTYTGTAYTDSSTGLNTIVGRDTNYPGYAALYPSGSTAQQNLIKMIMGADPSDTSKNRSDIVGDIVNSAPSYLEYDQASLPGSLAVPSGSRFRLILVGTNQGWLHAFGETSLVSKKDDPTSTSTPKAKIDLVDASVKELWAFMPTDFLKDLGYLNDSTKSHRFMVDGSPSIYFLDLPGSSGGSGNGKLDGAKITIDPKTDTSHERAIAIIGLRKGGRSYYALNLHDPTNPTLQWSLVPDEADSIPSDRNKTGLTDAALKKIVKNMGFSTCTPSFARVLFGGVYKDVVFFGGGLSLPEVEQNDHFANALLGRSVMALDVNTGDFLAAVDLKASSIAGTGTIGPISAGLVPFEFFLGSGMAQRAYFTDLWGGLWCWGSKNVVAETPFTGYANFRKDTSELQAWSNDGTSKSPYANTGIRKVYQDANSVAAASATLKTPDNVAYFTFSGPKYSTLPSPLLLGSFPGKGKTYTSGTTAVPAVAGIAMESGDRNDPLDRGNPTDNTRVTMVFDRQDSRGWGFDTSAGPDTGVTDTGLLAAGKWSASGTAIAGGYTSSDAVVMPGSSTYFLAPTVPGDQKYGYYVTFPDHSGSYYAKGISSPVVVSGTLYYSYFMPDAANLCTGGSGTTNSYKLCDILRPIAKETATGLTCTSGFVNSWFNVASDFTMQGTSGVLQVGTISTTGADGVVTIQTQGKTYSGQAKDNFPRARVWRTVR